MWDGWKKGGIGFNAGRRSQVLAYKFQKLKRLARKRVGGARPKQGREAGLDSTKATQQLAAMTDRNSQRRDLAFQESKPPSEARERERDVRGR